MDVLRIEDRGPARWLILNRPERRNALSRALLRALLDAVTAAGDSDQARCLVLTGEGPVFCAGADLSEFQEASDPAVLKADGELLFALLRALAGSPKPVIGRVQGPALGGGVGLIAALDYVVASRAARFSLSEVRLGLAPAVISPFVLRALGRRKALPLMQSGASIDALTAERVGLVHRAVAPEALDDAVDEMVGALVEAAPGALAAVKALVERIDGRPLAEVKETVIDLLAERRASAEGQEGMSAFLQKRAPSWKISR